MNKIALFGIIFDDKNRVLLCHRRDVDLWNLPVVDVKMENLLGMRASERGKRRVIYEKWCK